MDDFGPRNRSTSPDHYGCTGGCLGAVLSVSAWLTVLFVLDDAGGPLGFLLVLFVVAAIGLIVGSFIGLRIPRHKR
jgi:hypothetical protein